MTDQAIESGIYMRPLSRKQAALAMFDTLLEYWGQAGWPEARIELAKRIVDLDPRSIFAIMSIHSGYGQIENREFRSRYASPRDIPPTEHARYREIDGAMMSWLHHAEELGWREATDSANAEYMDRIARTKSAQRGNQ